MNRNSALYWYPRIEGIEGINLPRTKIVKLLPEDALILCANLDEFVRNYGEVFEEALSSFEFPIFVKTDELAGKHDWKDTCYVQNREVFYERLQALAGMSRRAGVPCQAILIREYIPLQSSFSFFHGEMPVSKERRYFVSGGTVVCHHPYWDKSVFQEAFDTDDLLVEKYGGAPRYPNGKRQEILKKLRELNRETQEEVQLLTKMASRVGQELEGEWSVDFACDTKGIYWLIDMALAKDSWHPKDCKARKPDQS